MHQLLQPQNPPMRIPVLFSWLFLMPICLLSMISFCISAVSGQCLANQQSLLLQFKSSLVFDTASSTKLVHWNRSVADCCSWEGVTCNMGRVIGLDLTNEFISSELDNSSSLFSLQYLRHLNLAYNNFSYEIPSQFDKLTNLNYLNLSNAGFTGQIPLAISHLTRLVTLDLSTYYYYHALQLENPNLNILVQNLSKLMELHLDYVNISAQGYEWGPALSSSLPKLRVLSLSDCLLSGPLDSSLTNIQSLSIIRLDDNDFFSPVPESFADFKNLTSLHLLSCSLNGTFPEKVFQIPTLQTLDLSYNHDLQGSLPEFPLNGSLRMLLLGGTNFSGTLPRSIGNLKMLSSLDLSGCNFNGSIPKSMASLTQLLYLDMSHNNFIGSISSRLNEFPNVSSSLLKTLDLSYNNLEGPIPMSLSFLPSLLELILSNNQFSGRLNEFPNVSSSLLETLDLSHNNLEGPIPMSLSFLPSLLKLTLSNNQFSGRLNKFPNVSSYLLETLDLSCNNLEGPIPMSVFKFRSLETLLLFGNNFSGSLQLNVIPIMRNLSFLDLSNTNLVIEYNGTSSSLSAFPQITTLSLASNKLKKFPHFLINLSTLEDLDLSDNQIHEEIPDWIWKLPSLDSLNISYNSLETLNLSLLNMSSVSSLDLHSNQLQGQFSVFPKFAKYLDFSKNNFSSVIPASIGDSLTYAYYLSLSSNKFYGSIPGSMCNATQLGILDLSNNFLSGPVPQCLFKMSEAPDFYGLGVMKLRGGLGVLNLRGNNLTGAIFDAFPSNCGLQTLSLDGNQLEGKLPKSLARCTSLELLNLGNNHIEDAFPCYLKNISMLRILILRSNKFYGPVDCRGINATWPKLQIVDLAANNFTGKLPIKYFSDWKAITDDKNEDDYLLHHHHHFNKPGLRLTLNDDDDMDSNYQDVITVTSKGQEAELVKILTIFSSLDFSCNNFDGPIPGEIGELTGLYILNLSHNAFRGQIPLSLGKLTNLESLDLSSNELTGEIPIQLADGLIFLSVLNLSFNQLVGKIPQIKQFATFLETSYEGNIGLCDFPLKEKCTREESGSSPPTSEETHSNSGNAIDWNFLSAELGFVFGFGIVIGPLMIWKRWRICYYKHADDIFFKMFPQLYIKIESCQRRANRNQGQRARRNQERRH